MQSCVKTVPPSSGNHPQKVPLATPKMHSFNQPFPKPDRNVLHYSVQFRSCPKLGGAGDKFGDYLCVDCANLPCVRGNNQVTNTTFTRPVTKISKSKPRSKITKRSGKEKRKCKWKKERREGGGEIGGGGGEWGGQIKMRTLRSFSRRFSVFFRPQCACAKFG